MTIVRTVSLDAFPDLFGEIEGQRPDWLTAAVRASALVGAEVIREEYRASGHDKGGELGKSTHVVPTDGGAEIRVDAPFAGHLERGTRPHTPPLAPLVAWAARLGVRDPFAVAKAVQQRIAREGTKPLWLVRSMLPALRQQLRMTCRDALSGRSVGRIEVHRG